MQCLKNGWQFNASEVQLTQFPSTHFDLVIIYGGVGMKLFPSYFFLDRELLFIDLKRGTHTK